MKNNLVVSQLTLRKIIGFLAVTFPFLLILGSLTGGVVPMLTSLSAYYWSNANVIFIGMLTLVGLFLITYEGYDKLDNIMTMIAGIAMICIAIFPMNIGSNYYLIRFIPYETTAVIHAVTAFISFALLGFMSFFQFTKNQGEITNNKKKRNLIYRICGIIIFVSIVLMIPAKIFPETEVIRLFFWLESLAIASFGVSWLVKGEALLKD